MNTLFFLIFTLALGAPAGSLAYMEPRTLERDDGFAIHYYLDRRGQTGAQGVLVLAQGSGCTSPVRNANIKNAAALAPDLAVVMLEKAGVSPRHQPAEPDTCPESFHTAHTLSGWAADLERVITQLRKEPWFNDELILFGGSEGGAMVTLAANRIPEADALVVLSSGLGMSLAEVLKSVVPSEATGMLEQQFKAIRDNPDSGQVWSEHAFRWWAEVLDRDFITDLLALDIPILLLQGGRDRMVPVESGRQVETAFADAGRTNLTYREYPELDHGMTDPEGASQLDEVIAEVGAWLEHAVDFAGDEHECN